MARKFSGRRAVLLLLIAHLTACNYPFSTTGKFEAGSTSNRPAEQPKAVTEPVAEQSDRAKQSGESSNTTVARTAPTPQITPPRKLITPLSVGALIGLDRQEARRLVGLPQTTSEQPPAIIWEYRIERCVMKLNFYLEVTKKIYRVLNTEFKIEDGSELSEQACLDAVRSAT